ncbi:MAG: hypothetical protein V1834_00785 [Candidatus Micrarchaeota archaeon]
MEYTYHLGRAWSFAKKPKAFGIYFWFYLFSLFFFGLIVLLGVLAFGASIKAIAENPAALANAMGMVAGLIGFLLVLFILGVVWVLVNVLVKAAVVRCSFDFFTKNEFGFSSAFKLARQHKLRLFGLFAVTFFLGLLASAVAGVFQDFPGLWFLLMLVFSLAVAALTLFFYQFAMVSEKGFGETLEAIGELANKNFLGLLLIMLVLIAVEIGFGVVLLILAVIGALIVLASVLLQPLVLIEAIVGGFILLALVSWMKTFADAFITSAFTEMVIASPSKPRAQLKTTRLTRTAPARLPAANRTRRTR